ncbi:hypothetical protein [Pradoshia sp.]
MFIYIMKRIDYINLIGFLVGSLILLIMRAEYLIGILLLAGGILLILSKINGSLMMYFLTYFVHLFLIGTIIYSLLLHNERIWSQYVFIGVSSLAIAVMAVLVRTSTGTLSLFWLCLHILIIIQAAISHVSFMSAYWSISSLEQVFHSFYPLLIASFLIGIFFDRFQTELKREYSNK